MRAAAVLSIAGVLAACETPLYPGPCSAVNEYDVHCVMTYDDAGRLTLSDCQAAPGAFDEGLAFVTTRTYQGDALATQTFTFRSQYSGRYDDTWMLAGDI